MIADETSRYRAPALDKGLDIVELLAATDESLSQAEIAKALGRSPNEIYRMLDRLVRRNYVAVVNGGRYELTLKLFALAHQHPPMRRLVSQAIPAMRQFARSTEQACHLAVFDRGSILVVAQVDSPTYWGLSIRVGARVGLLNTGSGHVLLAFASPKERAFMLEEREHMEGEAAPADFDRHLAEIRRDGYEMMDSHQTRGVLNLSVPVLGPDGNAIAALTCPFLSRLDRSDAPGARSVIETLKRAGRELSQISGGQTPELATPDARPPALVAGGERDEGSAPA
jgi:DNA-binding IclR family transcriptional regulator